MGTSTRTALLLLSAALAGCANQCMIAHGYQPRRQ
jgi:hypothetical protein